MTWRRWSINWKDRLQGENGILPLFKTREECRDYIRKHYGYIRTRKDLRDPPHNWKMPTPIRVIIAPEAKP
jgi:hypothetical protein